MYQALLATLGCTLSSLKAMASVKTVYTLAFAVLLASGILVTFPPTTTFAATCSSNCGQGETISVTGTTCSCTDNSGCTWTSGGKNYSSSCGTVAVSGGPAPILDAAE